MYIGIMLVLFSVCVFFLCACVYAGERDSFISEVEGGGEETDDSKRILYL